MGINGILRMTGSLGASSSTMVQLGGGASETRKIHEFRIGSNTTANVIAFDFENVNGWDGRAFILGSEQILNPTRFETPLSVDGKGGSLKLANTSTGTAVFELSLMHSTK